MKCVNHFDKFEEALIFAIHRLRSRNFAGTRVSRRDEPTWHDPATGIRTTNKSILDALYRSRDKEFPEEPQLGPWIEEAVDTVRDLSAIHGTSLMRPHIFYSLILAVIHLARVVPSDETFRRVRDKAIVLGIGRHLRPCEFVCTALPSRPQNLISDWLDEIRLTIELLCT